MKYKKAILINLFLLGLGLLEISAQDIYVKEKDGLQTSYALNSLKKMTFSSGNVNIRKIDNTVDLFALNELRYLNFIDLSTSIIKNPLQIYNANLNVYPNPVEDILNIKFIDVLSEGIISILTLKGEVIQTKYTNNDSLVSFNISSLPQGIYICRYVNSKETKTIKIIKL